MPSRTDPSPADLRRLVETMTPAERAALPARLRRLVGDEHTRAWGAAKAERDAALAAAETLPERDAARASWAARKAALIAAAPEPEG